MILGGGYLTDYSDSKSWGVNPATANGTVVISNTSGSFPSFTISVGDYIVYSLDSYATFYGVVSQTGAAANDPSSGVVQNFTVLDNRIRLAWQWVFAAFNMEDDPTLRFNSRPTAPSAPGDTSTGGDDGLDFGSGLGSSGGLNGAGTIPAGADTPTVKRRYWSILPQHQKAGIKTWHDEPFTTRQILNFAFDGAWGDFGFSRSYHSSLDDVILTNIDHLTGIRLSNFIAEINGKTGLDVTITGARSLQWDRKGEGLAPLPDTSSTNRSSGSAITTNDTKLRVMGERVRVQVANVELEPDWKPGWEKFIDELAWRREVALRFELDTETKADQADLSAKARQLTVWQYAKKINDPALVDYRRFGKESRKNMSAWAYIQEFVYRSYRIPPDRSLYGIPLTSLEMAESLLVATDIEGEGDDAKQVYATGTELEYYPAAQAAVIHKGQPLDLINARDIRLFYLNTTGDLRDQWTKAGDFEVDATNMSIRFAAPVFIDGLASEGKSIYLKLNKGEGGGTDITTLVDVESDYLDVVVPNPGYEITPASVKASFCFLLAPYQNDYGVGPRRGVLNIPGLGLHLLDTTAIPFTAAGTAAFTTANVPAPSPDGRNFREVVYEDGKTALEKATAAAQSQLALSPTEATGGFTRHGAAGTALSGAVDRVTVKITQSGGITEQVSYTKARATGVAFSEKTLTRIQRTEEMYPGQQELKKEIRDYRALAAALRLPAKKRLDSAHRKFDDVFSSPVGAESPSTTILYDKDVVAPTRAAVVEWRAGDIVWVDAKGVPSASGTAFGGVLVSKPLVTGEGEEATQAKELTVATRGIVPVRVRGAITAGGHVLATKGNHYGAATGDTTIGRLMHGEDVPVPDPVEDEPAEVLVMVSLGGGGGGAPQNCFFGELIDTPESDPVTQSIRGGIIYCGDQTWEMEPDEIDADTVGVWLVSIAVECVANTDDDNELLLPGIKTGTRPTGAWERTPWTSGTDYPANSNPAASDGIGTIHVPIGKLSVIAGVGEGAQNSVKFEPTGCGHITINHCAGTLSHDRG